MTYADPKRIRKNKIALVLDDYELEKINRLVSQTGDERGVWLRDLVMASVEHRLGLMERRSAAQPAANQPIPLRRATDQIMRFSLAH